MKQGLNLFLLFILVALAACNPQPAAQATSTVAAAATAAAVNTAPTATLAPTTVAPTAVAPTATAVTAVSDPFSYCAAVGTIDTPDSRYTGDPKPEAVINGLIKAAGISADAPLDWVKNTSAWRCMNGKVYACTVGANLPCEAKANTSQDPKPEVQDFCKQNPNMDFLPAAVTGHETIYEWSCQNGVAKAGKQVFNVDERGYIQEIWYALSN